MTTASITANANGRSVSIEINREGGRFVVVADGQPVAAEGSFAGAVGAALKEIRRRLPRGNPSSWGVSFNCNTTPGVSLAYGNRAGGGGGGGFANPCVAEAAASYYENTLPHALEHAAKTLLRCCN
jgi:hypothetical protein